MDMSSEDVAPFDTHTFYSENAVSTATISSTPLSPNPAARNSKKNGQFAN